MNTSRLLGEIERFLCCVFQQLTSRAQDAISLIVKHGKVKLHTREITGLSPYTSSGRRKFGMKESLRKSGIDVIGDVPWGTHFCQFYQTKEDLMDILVPYFKSGLENNELCLWVISQPLEVGEAKEALRRVVPDFDIYLEKGQIEIIPCTHENINEGVFGSENVIKGWVKKLDQVLAGGYEGLRTAGDISWSKKGELDDFVDYESEVDANIGKYQTISLFPYFLDMCSTADIIKIAFNHQFALIKKGRKMGADRKCRAEIFPCTNEGGGNSVPEWAAHQPETGELFLS
jgi:hypothetical protein